MKNVRRTAYGWQLYCRVRGRFISEHTQVEPTALRVRDWVRLQHATIKYDLATAPDASTFARDVETYLSLVQTMPTFRWRRDDLDRWIAVLGGNRPRSSVTAPVIRAQLETWRADGYAASTVNHRRTALMHLWTVLDGKSAPNPARDVPPYRDAPSPPRALSPAAVAAILDALPPGPMRARLRLMAWTGWPQAQIRRLEPRHVQWGTAVFMSREKGEGVEGHWIPLLPQGWDALKAFARAKAWGPFRSDAMRPLFRRAAARAAANKKLPKAVRAELKDVTPYQLRHSFGTLIAGITSDDRAVQTLMLHKDVRQTHRYTGATVDPRTAAAILTVTRLLQPVAPKRGVSRGSKRAKRKAS